MRVYLHDFHLQVFMQRWGDSESLQHLAQQLFLQHLHICPNPTHEPVITQELLMGGKQSLHVRKSSHGLCSSDYTKIINENNLRLSVPASQQGQTVPVWCFWTPEPTAEEADSTLWKTQLYHLTLLRTNK